MEEEINIINILIIYGKKINIITLYDHYNITMRGVIVSPSPKSFNYFNKLFNLLLLHSAVDENRKQLIRSISGHIKYSDAFKIIPRMNYVIRLSGL